MHHACLTVTRLFASPWTVALCRAPLSVGFPRQEPWSRLPFLLQGPSWPRSEPASPGAPALAGAFFTTESPGEPDFSLCYISILTCFGVFHLNINKQASNLLIPHPASDISSVQAPLHSRVHWEMLSSYLLHFLVSCGLSAAPSRLSPPSSVKAALLRSSVTSTQRSMQNLTSVLIPPSCLTSQYLWKQVCTFSLENFLYWFPLVSHSWAVPLLCSLLSIFPMPGT